MRFTVLLPALLACALTAFPTNGPGEFHYRKLTPKTTLLYVDRVDFSGGRIHVERRFENGKTVIFDGGDWTDGTLTIRSNQAAPLSFRYGPKGVSKQTGKLPPGFPLAPKSFSSDFIHWHRELFEAALTSEQKFPLHIPLLHQTFRMYLHFVSNETLTVAGVARPARLFELGADLAVRKVGASYRTFFWMGEDGVLLRSLYLKTGEEADLIPAPGVGGG